MYSLLENYVKASRKPFTSNDFRNFIEGAGVNGPADARGYGALFRRAQVEGLIESIGVVRTTRRAAHKRPVRVWQAVRPRPWWRFWL